MGPEVRARLPGAAREPAVRRLRPQPLPRVRHPQERRPPRLPAAQGRGAQRAHVRRHGHGLRRQGALYEAFNAVDEMEASGLRPSVDIYRSLLVACNAATTGSR